MTILDFAQKRRLVDAALAIRRQAYATYSDFAVGAAVLTEDGRILTGANVENASYGLKMCAERAAIFAAVYPHLPGVTLLNSNPIGSWILVG